MRAIMAGAVCWGLGAMPLTAETVYLEPREGPPIAVADVTFSDGMGYRIDWDDSKFGDYGCKGIMSRFFFFLLFLTKFAAFHSHTDSYAST